ncbi:MAG: M23 family metallopeptidase [Clostridiaceae bacterium]|nr:M23 family metallopeptidase [Clostridiaceae bacterium]
MSFENNDNNNNNKDNNEKGKLYKFLDKQGFYLILLLCVALVMTTAIWVSRQDEEFIAEDSTEIEEPTEVEVTMMEDEEEAAEDTATQPQKGVEIVESPRVEKEEEAKPKEIEPKEVEPKKAEPKEVEPQPELEKESEATAAKQQVMTQPVMGKVGMPFAMDKLVYHKTLDHWGVHRGVDIHAEEGAPVRAALDGEVVEVINDTVMGITITLKHEGDLYTRYSNLSTDAMVKVGQMVDRGQVISGVGRTASLKTEEGPLLHFQVLEDDTLVDPQGYLPKID